MSLPIQNLSSFYLNTPVFAFDIETDTNNYHWHTKRGLAYPAGITHISFYAPDLSPLVFQATPVETQYEYPFFNRETLEFEYRFGEQLQWSFTEEEDQFIVAMFTREYYTAVAHNLVFDARQIFGKYDIDIPETAQFWDTQAIHRFGAWGEDFDDDDEEEADKFHESFDLFSLTAHWLSKEDREWWASFKGQRKNLTKIITNEKLRNRLGMDEDEINRYVAIDSVQAYRLYEWQKAEIETNGFKAQYDEEKKIQTSSMVELLQYELDYTKLCVSMAKTGVAANIPYLHQEMQRYVALWKDNLALLGLTLETEHLFRSPKWQTEYIFSRIEAPTDKKLIEDYKLLTKTGSWSFNKTALTYYMESYPDLLYFRYHADLETKIGQIENFLRHSEYDGRIHFLLSRHTVTGRNSGSSPNTQNLQMKQNNKYPEGSPVKIPGGDAGYLVADEGKQLVSLDCSNGENWFAALYARDDAMAMACAAEDFHKVMASTAYFVDEWNATEDPEEHKRLRSIGKRITFGTAYGMGTGRLAREINITFDEAKTLLDNRDKRFWRVAKAKETSAAWAEKHGTTMLWTGRRIRIRKFNGKYKGYTAWNSLAQGGLGELIVRGMLRINERLKEFSTRIVTQVHDEIVLEVEPSEYKQVIIATIEELTTVIPELWNSRTIPKCRWLFTLDNIDNSKKWGYNPYQDYLLPLSEYVNQWGFHQYPQGAKEAPTWINQWGWGELALQKELGQIEDIPDIQIHNDLDWAKLRDASRDAYEILVNPVSVNGRMFVFPENIKVLRELYHKQGNPEYNHILEALDALASQLENYKVWRTY